LEAFVAGTEPRAAELAPEPAVVPAAQVSARGR
jgi:hypothetical protein